jgi:hypothetical protein
MASVRLSPVTRELLTFDERLVGVQLADLVIPAPPAHSGLNASFSTHASRTPAWWSRRYATGRLRTW